MVRLQSRHCHISFPMLNIPDEEGGKYRSFRDFIEYAYYITYVTPEQDFTVHPYLNCDILLQSGRLAALKGEKNRARAIFTSLSVLSPVNDSIIVVHVLIVPRKVWKPG